MPLLPATVRGPLTPLISRVRVDGVLPGAKVELLVNGAAADTGGAGSTTVYIALTNPLPANAVVAARWSLGGETSQPQPFPEKVLPLPAALGALTFVSPIHTAIDWVAVHGVFPGAEIEVTTGAGVVVGQEKSDDDGARVRITAPIGAGDQLFAVQRIATPGGTVESQPGESVAAEDWWGQERPLPPPTVVPPIIECAGAVLVANAIGGTTFAITRPSGQGFGDAVGDRFWAILGDPIAAADTFAAANVLSRLKRTSAQLPSVPVTVGADLPTPWIDAGGSCVASRSVSVQRLLPRAELLLEVVTATGAVTLGRAGVPEDATQARLWIPDLSAEAAKPGGARLRLTETLCAATSVAYLDLTPTFQLSPPQILPPFVACAEYVRAYNTWAVVELRSDAADWPILSSPTLVEGMAWLRTNRPLRPGETITIAALAGCSPGSGTGKVDGRKTPTVTVEGPIRPGASRVYVSCTLPGGEIHVFVNGHWRGHAAAIGTPAGGPFDIAVDVGTLREEDQVTAQETLCGKLGPVSPPVSVRTGTIRLTVDPTQAEVGKDVDLTFSAVDPDNGRKITGTVARNGQPFALTFNKTRFHVDGSPLHFTLDVPGYRQASVDVTLVQPPKPPPPPPAHGSDLAVVGISVINDGTVSTYRNEWVGHGEGFTTTIDVVNAGPDPAPAFKVEFFVDGASVGDEDVPGLAKGAGASVAHHYDPVADGNRKVAAVADSGGVVADANRGNNGTYFDIVVG